MARNGNKNDNRACFTTISFVQDKAMEDVGEFDPSMKKKKKKKKEFVPDGEMDNDIDGEL